VRCSHCVGQPARVPHSSYEDRFGEWHRIEQKQTRHSLGKLINSQPKSQTNIVSSKDDHKFDRDSAGPSRSFGLERMALEAGSAH